MEIPGAVLVSPVAPGRNSVSSTPPQRIAIFRALQLGDMLCAVPALSAARAAWPEATITLIGLPWAASFVERYRSLVDHLLIFPGAPGFPEQEETAAGLQGFFEEARVRRFDLAIQLHGSGGVANDILFELGAREHAGFLQPGESRAGRFMKWPDEGTEVERCLSLARFMELPSTGSELWIPLSSTERDESARLLEHCGVDGETTAIVHPGAQLPSRRWPAQRFSEIADAIAATGLDVLVTGSPPEKELAQSVCDAMKYPAVNLAGETSLGGLAALVERVALVVCNDTGLSHVAAAMRTPSVVVASGSDTRRWAPADRDRHRVIAYWTACRPCAHRVCPYGHECAYGVSPEEVTQAALAQLRGGGRPRERRHAA